MPGSPSWTASARSDAIRAPVRNLPSVIFGKTERQRRAAIEQKRALGYAALDGRWEVAVFARNITDEDNVRGGIDFNNNTGFVNDPRTFGISARFNY